MKIAVYCEAGRDTGRALIRQARRMAPDSRVTAVSEDAEPAALLQAGANEAIVLAPAGDDCGQGSRIAALLTELRPDIVLFPATVRGRFLSAWTAAKLGTGLTADCTGLALTQEGLLKQTRPAYGSNLIADILCPEKRPQMASVRPGVFPVPETGAPPAGSTVRRAEIPVPDPLMTLLKRTPPEEGVSLQDAEVIVAGGKGIGSPEGFRLLARLAALLGGALGATRSAVDAGWVSYAHQVGQTGVTVRPKLYLAFGVSGAVQHTAGMNASRTVVAVNTDRHAPIFRSADYGIIADWRETAEEFIRIITERKEKA